MSSVTVNGSILLMVQKSGQPVDMENIPLFTGFFYIPGGCLGFLPSTVAFEVCWNFHCRVGFCVSMLCFLAFSLDVFLELPPKRDAMPLYKLPRWHFSHIFENLEPSTCEISCEIQLLSGIKFCKLFGMGHFDLFPYRRDTLQIHTFGGGFFSG